MKKTKISKRLAVLLVLLVIVAVGGAYVLNSVNTGEGVLAAAVYKATGASGIPMSYEVQNYGATGKMDYFSGFSGVFGNEYWKQPSNNPLYKQDFAEKAKKPDEKKPEEEEKKKCSPFLPSALCDGFGSLENKVGRDKAVVGAAGDCAKESSCKGFKATKNSDGTFTITPF